MTLFGTRVIESPYMKDGEIMAMAARDPIDLPLEWDAMPETDKLAWLVANNAIVFVKNLDVLRPQNARSAQ